MAGQSSSMTRSPATATQSLAKAAIDRAVALVGLCASLPLIAAAALAVVLEDRGSPFFVHQRPGLGGRPFKLIKLRTMRTATGPDGAPLPDGQRITRVGAFLRRTSIDELPQLWNVLRGELSLVGPRPLLMRYLPRYSREQARRHEVKPGITGWAQVNGRNTVDWPKRLRLDVWYVDHWSLGLDLRILALTAGRVLGGAGVSAPGEATMQEFMGNGGDDAR